MQSIAFFLITIGIESFPAHKWNVYTTKEWWSSTKTYYNETSQGPLEPLLGSYNDSSVSIIDEDVDVVAERDKVLSGATDNAIIHLRNLHKVLVTTQKFALFSILKKFVFLKLILLASATSGLH